MANETDSTWFSKFVCCCFFSIPLFDFLLSCYYMFHLNSIEFDLSCCDGICVLFIWCFFSSSSSSHHFYFTFHSWLLFVQFVFEQYASSNRDQQQQQQQFTPVKVDILAGNVFLSPYDSFIFLASIFSISLYDMVTFSLCSSSSFELYVCCLIVYFSST